MGVVNLVVMIVYCYLIGRTCPTCVELRGELERGREEFCSLTSFISQYKAKSEHKVSVDGGRVCVCACVCLYVRACVCVCVCVCE